MSRGPYSSELVAMSLSPEFMDEGELQLWGNDTSPGRSRVSSLRLSRRSDNSLWARRQCSLQGPAIAPPVVAVSNRRTFGANSRRTEQSRKTDQAPPCPVGSPQGRSDFAGSN